VLALKFNFFVRKACKGPDARDPPGSLQAQGTHEHNRRLSAAQHTQRLPAGPQLCPSSSVLQAFFVRKPAHA
jgi:hypothetical protein